MADAPHLDWFRQRLIASAAREATDPSPILSWREALIRQLDFSAALIGLAELREWGQNEDGNIVHASRQFFSIEGVRVGNATSREVYSWDQPIYNQIEGGILALVAQETPGAGIQFLLHAKAEPGSIGWLQLCPTIQCTQSNLKRAHKGRRPPMAELLLAEHGVRLVYSALHNEEGGRFWRKSNENRLIFVSDQWLLKPEYNFFQWASLSQIKALAITDNVLSPFVKSIVAPL
jgi:oxidase EvaA